MFGNKKTKAVVCDECKHLTLESAAKKVEYRGLLESKIIFFCPEHTPEYDVIGYKGMRVKVWKSPVQWDFRYVKVFFKRIPEHLQEIKIKK